MSTVLVTGGAGFIGTHVCHRLRHDGHDVRVLDALEPQVHGPGPVGVPSALSGIDGIELVHGDVTDESVVDRALEDVDRVLHLAAQVGVGQSMYEPARYIAHNTLGTATLLHRAIERGVDRIVTASSMSVYGEGAYVDAAGTPVEATRDRASARGDHWDPTHEGSPLEPVPTPETKRPDLASVYALSKYDQERLTLMLGSAYDVPSVALRFFNTYGPGQALQNPYTGVLAIFAARLLNDQPPLVYEDGHQLRDFIHVDDVARACCLALDSDTHGNAINIGTGTPRSVLDVAHDLAKILDKDIAPEVLHKMRTGDVRHCYAETTLARRTLGFAAETSFETGLRDLADWLREQAPEDRVPSATQELTARGLVQ